MPGYFSWQKFSAFIWPRLAWLERRGPWGTRTARRSVGTVRNDCADVPANVPTPRCDITFLPLFHFFLSLLEKCSVCCTPHSFWSPYPRTRTRSRLSLNPAPKKVSAKACVGVARPFCGGARAVFRAAWRDYLITTDTLP